MEDSYHHVIAMSNRGIHVGIIPDGNRRYAKKHNISLKESYSMGIDKFLEVCGWAKEYNVSEISVYALSKENLKRDKTQLNILFNIFKIKIQRNFEKFNENNDFYIRFYGDIPKELEPLVKKIESKNPLKYKIKVNVLLGYSGREEIIKCVNEIIKNNIKRVDQEKFREFLYIKNDPDLIIRTGGFQRISNFLIFQSAYSELYFLDKLWNEFTKQDFEKAIVWFKNQKRNFGR